MHKKINTLIIVFSILFVLSFIWILFLKFDYYTNGVLIKYNDATYIVIKQNEFNKLNNKKRLKIKYQKNLVKVNVNESNIVENYCLLLVDDINKKHDELLNIQVYLKSNNLFGF